MSGSKGAGKRCAGRAGAELVESGMRIGLGSGSTFLFALEHLAERMQEEGLEFLGVPTSEGTAASARRLGVPLASLEEFPELDLTLDGADEVSPGKHLIKGGGAALVREKIVAAASKEMVVMVDETKLVRVLGKDSLLPVEVLPFGWRQAARRLSDLECRPHLRQQGDGQPLITDNGNYILDCEFVAGISDPEAMEQQINLIPGVLDNGLFVHMAGRVLVGRILVGNDDGEVRTLS